jgi:RNase LS, bacterial toxin N-terminal/RNase LS, bacterial toxin DBD domain
VSSDFKELNLDRTRLQESTRKFCEANNCQNYKYLSDKPSLHQVEYSQDDCKVMVNFYLNKNGTTTINPNVGKSQEKGKELAVYLKDELVGDARKSVTITTRSLEGVMRRLLYDKEYYVEDHKNSFGEVFYKNSSTRKYFVRDDLKHQLGSKTCEALECCYDYFVEQRHELFHTSDFTDISRIIPTQEQASQIIEKVVKIIEVAYGKLLS